MKKSKLERLAEWAEDKPWANRTIAVVLLTMSPFTITYVLWREEWSGIVDAYTLLIEVVKTGEV